MNGWTLIGSVCGSWAGFTLCQVRLSSRAGPFRQIDKAATSLVLNIAEGNGRRLEGDRWTFSETAESAVVKAGAYLPLRRRTGAVEASSGEEGMALLDRAALLVRGLRDYWRGAETRAD